MRAAALANPNAGEVIVSAAPGWEFVDLAGRHHSGGGSHGSLEAADSEVPMLTVGLGPPPASITGIKELVAAHFGVPVRRARLTGSTASCAKRGIRDARVLDAMRAVPRESFVPAEPSRRTPTTTPRSRSASARRSRSRTSSR